MAVGAYAAYNLELRLPGLPLLASFFLGGLVAAGVGLVFGVPSLRLRGFYLAVSTLAAQFFLQWSLTKFGWFSNYSASGVISAPPMHIAGLDLNSPVGRYLLVLSIVTVLTVVAIRLVASPLGREFIAVRDNEVAARIIGVPVLRVKLFAFTISSFYVGVAGALWAFAYLRTIEPHGFDLIALVPDPVHDHHRRHRQHTWCVPRRRLHQRHAAAAVPARQLLRRRRCR